MADFREYLVYSEKYLDFARAEKAKNHDIEWLLIPALTLAWSSIELFINNMLDDFASLPDGFFQMHERALLQEKRLTLNTRGNDCGNFTLEGTEYRSLEDKILFLIAKVGKGQNIKGGVLWNNFVAFKNKRDTFIHPSRNKQEQLILTIDDIESFIGTAKEVIQLVASDVWKKDIDF